MLEGHTPVKTEGASASNFIFSENDNDYLDESAIHSGKTMRKTAIRSVERTFSRRRLADHIRPGVRILFVGINPGLRSAATGHHFAGYSNRFWRLLFESRLVTEPLTHQDDWRLPDWGIGLTNIIHRPSAGIDVLRPREYQAGRKRLIAVVTHYRPHIVALLGVTIYRMVFPDSRTERIGLGLQVRTLADRPVFVLPNPSGRNAYYQYRTMLMAFRALRNVTKRKLRSGRRTSL
jgi:TDG/mug DNA glycosylase family protein